MHGNHLGPCLVLAGLAVALMIGLGVGLSSLIPFAVFLLCPLVMGAMFWWMARGNSDSDRRHEHPRELR